MDVLINQLNLNEKFIYFRTFILLKFLVILQNF
ncbi:hypothetical protein HNP72_002151 [Sphingobacterium soli]|nr:hypothetical protein [Sphingobacterium soli]